MTLGTNPCLRSQPKYLMLYGIQRLAELNPKSFGARECQWKLTGNCQYMAETTGNRSQIMVHLDVRMHHLAYHSSHSHPQVLFVVIGSQWFETGDKIRVLEHHHRSLTVVAKAHSLSYTKHYYWGCGRGKEEALFCCAVAILSCFLAAEIHSLSPELLLLFVWCRVVNHIPVKGRVPGFDWLPNQTGPILLLFLSVIQMCLNCYRF